MIVLKYDLAPYFNFVFIYKEFLYLIIGYSIVVILFKEIAIENKIVINLFTALIKIIIVDSLISLCYFSSTFNLIGYLRESLALYSLISVF